MSCGYIQPVAECREAVTVTIKMIFGQYLYIRHIRCLDGSDDSLAPLSGVEITVLIPATLTFYGLLAIDMLRVIDITYIYELHPITTKSDKKHIASHIHSCCKFDGIIPDRIFQVVKVGRIDNAQASATCRNIYGPVVGHELTDPTIYLTFRTKTRSSRVGYIIYLHLASGAAVEVIAFQI